MSSSSAVELATEEKKPINGPQDLPNELFHRIMAIGQFSTTELWHLRAVSRAWNNKLTSNKLLWKHLDVSMFRKDHASASRRFVELFGDFVTSASVGNDIEDSQERSILNHITATCDNLRSLSANPDILEELSLRHPERLAKLTSLQLSSYTAPAGLDVLLHACRNIGNLQIKASVGMDYIQWVNFIAERMSLDSLPGRSCPNLLSFEMDFSSSIEIAHLTVPNSASNLTSIKLLGISQMGGNPLFLDFIDDAFASLKVCVLERLSGPISIGALPKTLEKLVLRDLDIREVTNFVLPSFPKGLKHLETNYSNYRLWLPDLKQSNCLLEELKLETDPNRMGPGARILHQWIPDLVVEMAENGLTTKLQSLTIRSPADGALDEVAELIHLNCPALTHLTILPWLGTMVVREDSIRNMLQKRGEPLKTLYFGTPSDGEPLLSMGTREFKISDRIKRVAQACGTEIALVDESHFKSDI